MSTNNFHGIILYDIELSECLNGVWTNQPNKGVIRNEIAKRVIKGSDEIVGTYQSSYIEIDDNIHRGTLTITIEPTEVGVYSFLWVYENGNTFKGKGYRMNERQITVHYWEGK